MNIEKLDVLLTGSTGFVGGAVANQLTQNANINLHLAVRSLDDKTNIRPNTYVIPDFCDSESWTNLVKGKEVVIHCAARVHVMNETVKDALSAFRQVNVKATRTLAEQAACLGVKRFIFISSVKVNGECSEESAPYRASDIPQPLDSYGISKYEAEEELKKIGTESGMEIVIIRPVLVYGPGVKANFYNMMKWVHRGIPLPLGDVRNRRSLIYIDNLADLIIRCIDHPAAANETFLASDGEDYSTTELLKCVAECMGRSSRLISIPEAIIQAVAASVGKREIARRLLGSLVVDISKTREALSWSPPVPTSVAIKRTVDFFLSESNK